MRGLCADHHAVFVGIQPIARAHPNALNQHVHVFQARLASIGWQWQTGQGTNAHIKHAQLGHIAHTAVDHHTGPAIFGRRCTQVAPQQSPAQ